MLKLLFSFCLKGKKFLNTIHFGSCFKQNYGMIHVHVTSMIVSSNLSANLSQRNSSTSSRLNSLSKCLFFHELYRWIIDSLIFEGSFSTEIPLLNLSTIFEAISALSVFTDNIGLFAAMYS